MRFIDLQQGSQEWLDWRSQGLGASDATIVAEVEVPWASPTTRRQLWELKTGRTAAPQSNFAQRRGQRLEPLARRLYEEYAGVKVEPCCVEHERLPWLRASLDGLTEWADRIVELKAPRWESHAEALEGRVPSYYLPQLLHQAAATGVRTLDYVSFSEHSRFAPGEQLAVVRFEPTAAQVAELVALEAAFWALVVLDWYPEAEAGAVPGRAVGVAN